MKSSRWLWIGGAIVLLVLIIAYLMNLRPSSILNVTDETGYALLAQWMKANGYQIKDISGRVLDPTVEADSSADALVILLPSTHYTTQQAHAIQNWVRQGKTLIVASYPWDDLEAFLGVYQLELSLATNISVNQASSTGPVLVSPPLQTSHGLTRTDNPKRITLRKRPDASVALVSNQQAVLIHFPEGQGHVWILDNPFLLNNWQLSQTEASARLALNIFSTIKRGGTILFDAYLGQLGSGSSEADIQRDLRQRARASAETNMPVNAFDQWLWRSPGGWAVLSLIALTMLYLGLRGRHFGRIVPLPEERLRRDPLEYVQAMANLYHRSGQREHVLKHYHAQFVRQLATRYGVDVRASDAELVKQISQRDSTVNAAELRALLARFSTLNLYERDLVQLIQEVRGFLARITGQTQ